MLPGKLLAERVLRGMEAAGYEDMSAFKKLIERDARFMAVASLPALQISMDMISQEAKNSLAEISA